jgi:hypothetical protein
MSVNSETGSVRALALPGTLGSGAFWRGTRAGLAACSPVFVLAGLYVIAAIVLSATLPGSQPVDLFEYVGLWLRGGFALGLLYLLARTLPSVIRTRPDRPLTALGGALSGYVTPSFLVGVSLIGTQCLVKGTFTSIKNMLPDVADYTWDARWADFDAWLTGGTDPWRYLEPVISRPLALHLVEMTYLSGWMLMVGIVPAIVAFAPRFAPTRVRFFLTYILCWIVIGNILAAVGMSAGPAYYDKVTGDVSRFRPLLDHLSANSGSFYSVFDLQILLWRAYDTGQVSLGTGISAFPSMHIAMATLWVIVGFTVGKRFGIAALVFLAFIFASSIALGWHYAVDGYVSMIIVPVIWFLVGRLPFVARSDAGPATGIPAE